MWHIYNLAWYLALPCKGLCKSLLDVDSSLRDVVVKFLSAHHAADQLEVAVDLVACHGAVCALFVVVCPHVSGEGDARTRAKAQVQFS